jgi:hypothetical protein
VLWLPTRPCIPYPPATDAPSPLSCHCRPSLCPWLCLPLRLLAPSKMVGFQRWPHPLRHWPQLRPRWQLSPDSAPPTTDLTPPSSPRAPLIGHPSTGLPEAPFIGHHLPPDPGPPSPDLSGTWLPTSPPSVSTVEAVASSPLTQALLPPVQCGSAMLLIAWPYPSCHRIAPPLPHQWFIITSLASPVYAAIVSVTAVGLVVLERAGAAWSQHRGSSPSKAASNGAAKQATLPSSGPYGWTVEVSLRSPSRCNLLAAAAFPEMSADLLSVFEDEVYLPPKDEDECLTPEILLHIAYEVVSQLDNAEEFRQFSLDELSLGDFLVEQIHILEPVVEAQEDFVSPLAQDIVGLAQDPWPCQLDVTSFGRYSCALPSAC